METKKCEYSECKNPISESKRIDAIYCCAEHGTKVRNERKKNNKAKTIFKLIIKNDKILEQLFKKGKDEITKDALNYQDFNFNYYTSMENPRTYCYINYKLTITENICKIEKI